METDASNMGIGAVLVQAGHPLAFLSKDLGPRWQKLSVYEKELLAVVTTVQNWEQYLIGEHFVIKTDQKSLIWLLQQKISTPFQQLWLSKLMGFNYDIVYRSGSENAVADALSRVFCFEVLCLALTVLDSNLAQKLKDSYELDVNTTRII